MAIKTMDDLFLHTLKDIYYAERQILKALPKMAKAASSSELRQAFDQHRTETEGQIERLAQVFEMLGKPARGVKCEAIEGILEEGQSIMEEVEDPEVRDAAMLASAQAVEHYEITRYGTLISWAKQIGHEDAVALLEQTLEEEKSTDQLLSELAEETINQKAA
ncbi:MAG: ferritin-like domain-containing protein [Methylobacterium sp.]|nr:ferritin-like domain-containing protein [Methylobacterium sp.]